MSRILKGEQAARFGCDFVLDLPAARAGSDIVLLQLTDTQIIDESQTRTPERLRHDERSAWSRANIRVNCYDHIRSLVAQACPDLIFFTGDVIYGSFDDSGEVFADFIAFMDSLGVPWGMTFGNHDNEAAIGVERQCELLTGARMCMFARGSVTGNSNYSMGVSVGGQLRRVIYFLDTHGCLRPKGILPDQLQWLRSAGEAVGQAAGGVPGFLAFHIPVDRFRQAEYDKGYASEEQPDFVIGVNVPAKDGDFGFRLEDSERRQPDSARYIPTDEAFDQAMTACRVDGVFVGHCHKIACRVLHRGVQWVFGLKTGQYDYHLEGQLGGTVVTLDRADNRFRVHCLPVMTALGPFPSKGPVYTKDFLLD